MMSRFFLLLQMFILFYNIPFVPYVSTVWLYSLYAICMIFLKYRREFRQLSLRLQKYYKLFIAFGLYLVITSLSCLIYNIATGTGVVSLKNFIVEIYRFIILTAVSFLTATYLAILCVKKKVTFDNLMQLFVLMACIQFIFVAATYISPTAKDFVLKYLFTHVTKSSGMRIHISNPATSTTRMFGFAGGLFESFGFSSTMCFMSAIYLGFKRTGCIFS